MLIVQYQPDITETTNATIDFLNRRPIVKIVNVIMKICCAMMSVACVLKVTANILNIHDILVLIFALTWLFGYRTINRVFLKKILTHKKINTISSKFHINKDKLWWLNNNKQPLQQAWHKIKYIYKNQDGYIIPAVGMSNAGKFIWLPKRGFSSLAEENNFLDIVQQFNILIK